LWFLISYISCFIISDVMIVALQMSRTGSGAPEAQGRL
jgi:hypothetical protein